MSATPGSVSIESDVVFGSAGDLELKGDIYHPPAALNKRTAVIHVYGGGFERGNRVQAGDAAHKFAERGLHEPDGLAPPDARGQVAGAGARR